MRIVVAMSGGVDSSVAASLLAEAGHDVIGLSMQLYDQRESPRGVRLAAAASTTCTTRAASPRRIGIPALHRQLRSASSSETVVANFVGEYAAGRTPIPCVHCNARPEVRDARRARRRASTPRAVATGHYARVDFDEDARALPAAARRRPRQGPVVLPVLADAGPARARASSRSAQLDEAGGARARARGSASRVADKPDSHEICFVPDGDAAGFVERQLGDRAARRARSSTRAAACSAGTRGIHRFTVGQRKGLGLSTGAPLYVLRLEPADARRRRRPARGARRHRRSRASRVNWIAGAPPAEPAPRHRAHPPSPSRRARARHRRRPTTRVACASTSRRSRSRRARRWCSTTARGRWRRVDR